MADVAIDAALVSALLHEQHPDRAHLPLSEVGRGWDAAAGGARRAPRCGARVGRRSPVVSRSWLGAGAGLAYVAGSKDGDPLIALGRTVIAAALGDQD